MSQTTRPAIDLQASATLVIDALEECERALERATSEAARLAEACDDSLSRFPRFGTAVSYEAQGVADYLPEGGGSEFSVRSALEQARELRQLIELAETPARTASKPSLADGDDPACVL